MSITKEQQEKMDKLIELVNTTGKEFNKGSEQLRMLQAFVTNKEKEFLGLYNKLDGMREAFGLEKIELDLGGEPVPDPENKDEEKDKENKTKLEVADG